MTAISEAKEARKGLAAIDRHHVQCIDCSRNVFHAVKDAQGWHCLPCRYPRRRPHGLDVQPIGANFNRLPYNLSVIEGDWS